MRIPWRSTIRAAKRATEDYFRRPSVVLAGLYDVPATVLAVPSHRGIAQLAQGLQNVAIDGWVTVFVGVDPFVAEGLRDAWHHGFLVNGFFSVDRIEDPLGNFWCIGHLLSVLVRGTERTTRIQWRIVHSGIAIRSAAACLAVKSGATPRRDLRTFGLPDGPSQLRWLFPSDSHLARPALPNATMFKPSNSMRERCHRAVTKNAQEVRNWITHSPLTYTFGNK